MLFITKKKCIRKLKFLTNYHHPFLYLLSDCICLEIVDEYLDEIMYCVQIEMETNCFGGFILAAVKDIV